MRFVWGFLVSSLLAMGLSACTSSDDEWSGERTPSREAVDDVSEAKSEPEVAADDVPDAGPAAATDDVPEAEAESEPAAAARANDKEAECRDPWILDFDAEDRAGNREEQVVFVLELNESADSDGEDGGSVKCKVSLDEIDWTSIRDVQRLFELISKGAPEIIETENVSNTVKVDPNPILYETETTNVFGTIGKYDDLTYYESAEDPHKTFVQSTLGGYVVPNLKRFLQPNAAVLPSHQWRGFYQDQHLMTFGVCDAIDEEATVFFFDPNFIDEKYEYHKVWSEGSTITQRSIPAPRFRFPYKAEDAVQQPQLIGIKIVDVATKQPVGAALIQVFVTQVKTEAGKPTIEGGKPPEDLYGCKFDLHISRTYTKEVLEERAFAARVIKIDSPKAVHNLTSNFGNHLNYRCKGAVGFNLTAELSLMLKEHLRQSDVAISYATATEAATSKWLVGEYIWEGQDKSLDILAIPYDSPYTPHIEELLVTVANHDGDPFSRQYYWLQVDNIPDTANCKFKVNSLLMHFQANDTKYLGPSQLDDWKEFFKK